MIHNRTRHHHKIHNQGCAPVRAEGFGVLAVGILEKLRLGSRKWDKTIVVVKPKPRMKEMGIIANGEATSADEEGSVKQDTFKIRLAHDAERTREARFLVEKRYRDVGYHQASNGNEAQACPERITLATYREEQVVGTLTVGFDTGTGLLADQLYKTEIDELRKQGRKVCELTKLAIDGKKTSKRLLAGLFHIAYIYVGRIWGYTDILIEVNPAHVSFYQRMLNFEVMGDEKMCARVHAPAVLLRIEVSKGQLMIETVGGHPELARQERSLYPYFLGPEEEHNIIQRLMQD